jgi:hypothetical protein
MSHDGTSHAWLFSFVDLAFLLLMVMSQLADPHAGPPLGEIVVPRIEAPDARPVRTAARAAWQLRVLHGEGIGKPLLAPHADSRSEDLLEALAALEAQWSGSRRTAVSPQVAWR